VIQVTTGEKVSVPRSRGLASRSPQQMAREYEGRDQPHDKCAANGDKRVR